MERIVSPTSCQVSFLLLLDHLLLPLISDHVFAKRFFLFSFSAFPPKRNEHLELASGFENVQSASTSASYPLSSKNHASPILPLEPPLNFCSSDKREMTFFITENDDIRDSGRPPRVIKMRNLGGAV